MLHYPAVKKIIQDRFADIRSFTLIEMMVAVAIFSFVLILGSGIFVLSVRQESNAIAVQNAQDNLRYVLQEMARTIRVSTWNTNGTGCPAGNSYPTTSTPNGTFNALPITSYNLINPNNTSTQVGAICYYLSSGTIYETVPNLSISSLPLTGPNVSISNLSFYTQNFGSSSAQARVTILVDLSVANSAICSTSNPCVVQATTSLRNLNQ